MFAWILPLRMPQRYCGVWAGPGRFSQRPPVAMRWGQLRPVLQAGRGKLIVAGGSSDNTWLNAFRLALEGARSAEADRPQQREAMAWAFLCTEIIIAN